VARIHKRTVKKDLHDPENHNGVITHLEPDILECEVKWALESITTNKARRWWNSSWAISNAKRWWCESAELNMPANLKNSEVATELEKLFWTLIFYPFSAISSVQFSRSVMSDSLQSHGLQHARPPCPSQTPGVDSDSSPSSQWCRLAISSSGVPFSSCPQSLPASRAFPMSQFFTSGGQSIGVSSSASVLQMNIQDDFL